MDIFEAIYTRRSIRKFTGEPVDDDALKMVLRAGFCAPSAHNYRPWHFVVIKNMSMLERIAQFHPYAKMLPQAGCCIIVCGDKEKQGMVGFLIEDCSAAIQNMLLAAHGAGLGAVWCGLYPLPKLPKPIIKLLGLSRAVIPVGMVVVGRKNEQKEPADRFDDTRIHLEKW